MRTKAEHDYIRSVLPMDLRALYDEATRHLQAKRAKPIIHPGHGLATGDVALAASAPGCPDVTRFAIVVSDSDFYLAETREDALAWAGREHELATAYPI